MRYWTVGTREFRHFPDAIKFRNSFKYSTPVIFNRVTYNPILIIKLLWR